MPKQTQSTTTPAATRTNAPARPAPVRAGPSAESLVQRALADPSSLTAQDVVKLQRQIGNNATTGLLSRSPATAAAPTIQRVMDVPARSSAAAGFWYKSYFMGPSLTKLGGAAVQRAPWERATPTGVQDGSAPSSGVTIGSQRQGPPVTVPPVTSPSGIVIGSQRQGPPVSSPPQSVTTQDSDVEDDDETETDTETTPPTPVTDQVPDDSGNAPLRPTTDVPTTGPTTVTAPPRPTSIAPIVPVYPTFLTEGDWGKNKSFIAKLGRDDIGRQLGIVNAAHRGVVWNRFDIVKLPPSQTVYARASVATEAASTPAVEAAKAALEAAKNETDVNAKLPLSRKASAAVSEAKGLLDATRDAAKAAADEAELLLSQAKAEFKRSVMLVLGRLQMVTNLLAAKRAKSPSPHLAGMIAAAGQYQRQLMSVTEAYKAFEAVRDAAKARLAAVTQAMDELDIAEEEDNALLGGSFGVIDDDELEDDDGNPVDKPVGKYLGAKFFADLGTVKFPDNRDMQAWLSTNDANLSAKDETRGQPNLVRLQDQSQEAAEDFIDNTEDLRDMENDVMPREAALDKVNDLWDRAARAFGDENSGGLVGLHRQWARQQLTLAGSTGKYDAFKKKYARVLTLYTKAGTVLKADETVVKKLAGAIEQASH